LQQNNRNENWIGPDDTPLGILVVVIAGVGQCNRKRHELEQTYCPESQAWNVVAPVLDQGLDVVSDDDHAIDGDGRVRHVVGSSLWVNDVIERVEREQVYDGATDEGPDVVESKDLPALGAD